MNDFFEISLKILDKNNIEFKNDSNWKETTKNWLKKYPIVLDKYWKKSSPVNPYCFIDKLFENLNEDDIVILSDGTAARYCFSSCNYKKRTKKCFITLVVHQWDLNYPHQLAHF